MCYIFSPSNILSGKNVGLGFHAGPAQLFCITQKLFFVMHNMTKTKRFDTGFVMNYGDRAGDGAGSGRDTDFTGATSPGALGGATGTGAALDA